MEQVGERWRWVVFWVMAMAVGCTGGPEVVGEADRETLDGWLVHEVVEEEVSFQAGGTEVYGTLTKPQEEVGIPAVVLVAGSGPTDRDWNNPLLPGENGTAIELSRRLAQAGVGVLRYDKRGTGHTELEGEVVWEDYLSEIEGAVNYVRQREEIDGERVVLGGHSEGGIHALRAVTEGWTEVAGTMLLATPGRSTAVVLEAQVRQQLEGSGLDEDFIDGEMEGFVGALEAIGARREVDSREVTQIPGLVSLLEMLQEERGARFAAELLRFDPSGAIQEMEGPVLVLAGGKDLQVDAQADGRRLAEAGEQAGVALRFRVAEEADHVLKYQPIPRENLNEQHGLSYNDPSRRLDEGVLQVMVEWLREEVMGEEG